MELPEEVANRVLWRTYVWRFHPDEYHATWWRDVAGVDSAEWRGVSGETEPAPVNSMVLVVQPPWILALQDMKNFTKCTNVSVPMLVNVSVLCIDSDVCVPFCSYHHYRTTRLRRRVNLTVRTVYGRICSTRANGTSVIHLC